MKINLNTPISTQLSYGIVGLNLVKSLTELGHEVSLFPIGQLNISQESVPYYEDCLKNGIENAKRFDTNSSSVRIFHQFSMGESIGSGQRVGFPIFELDRFNETEQHHLNSLDKIIVCSEWAKKIVLNQTKKEENNICVVPLGVDNNIFRPTQNHKDKKVFLNIGKWEKRKGHDLLFSIFLDAFPYEKNVELWLMSSSPFYSKEENDQWEKLYRDKLGDRVKFLPPVQTSAEVAYIINQVDCGIFPYRAEGWNMGLLEMMGCGKHVIASDYSGPTQFLNKDNAHLVEVEDLEIAEDSRWFRSGIGSWAKLNPKQVKDFSQKMRSIYDWKRCGGSMVNTEGIKTAGLFSWENSAKKLMEVL